MGLKGVTVIKKFIQQQFGEAFVELNIVKPIITYYVEDSSSALIRLVEGNPSYKALETHMQRYIINLLKKYPFLGDIFLLFDDGCPTAKGIEHKKRSDTKTKFQEDEKKALGDLVNINNYDNDRDYDLIVKLFEKYARKTSIKTSQERAGATAFKEYIMRLVTTREYKAHLMEFCCNKIMGGCSILNQRTSGMLQSVWFYGAPSLPEKLKNEGFLPGKFFRYFLALPEKETEEETPMDHLMIIQEISDKNFDYVKNEADVKVSQVLRTIYGGLMDEEFDMLPGQKYHNVMVEVLIVI